MATDAGSGGDIWQAPHSRTEPVTMCNLYAMRSRERPLVGRLYCSGIGIVDRASAERRAMGS